MRKGRRKSGKQPRDLKKRTAAERADKPPDLLVARGVQKAYLAGAVEVEALRDIHLNIAEGSFVAVTGPSGSGKTTLLQCLSGLDDVDAGSVTVAGENVHELPEPRRSAQRARLMGFVFQSLNLLPVFSAVENVELPLMINRFPARETRDRAREALERVGLGDRLDHRPGELSGGEQQRVAVARALVTRPALVWADEPTGSLDTASAREMVGLLEELNSRGTTFVLVTHNPEVAEVAQRRISMLDGEIVEDSR